MTRRLGDGQRVILRQSIRGSVRAVRAVWYTRVFQTEIRVVADESELRYVWEPIILYGKTIVKSSESFLLGAMVDMYISFQAA